MTGFSFRISTAALAVSVMLAACGSGTENVDAPAPAPADTGPDLILTGPIYTGNPEQPVAAWLAVEDGYISDIGTEPLDGTRAVSQVIDLTGSSVAYPGFTDAHAHLIGIGMREMTLNLEGTSSVAQLKQRVAAEAESRPAGEVIVGRGWIETGWPEERFPNRDDLDEAAPDNPVVLTRADGHALVANTAALDAAGITGETPNPDGGRIERDAAGRATGILIDNAMADVEALVDAPSEDQRREALRLGAEVYAGYGWTGLHNMSVDPADAQLIASLEEMGELPIRVYNALNPDGLDELVETGFWEMNDGKVTTRTVKFYVDGALGSRGAALAEPYSDQPDTSGLVLLSEDEAKAAWTRARDNGIQVVTHAIGDRGNTLVLDWYEDVLPEGAQSYDEGPRWRIEHAQILDPADITRFAALGVIPSMQPSHAIGDLHFAPARLGAARLNGAYAWASLTDAGAIVAGGSDAPVERGDPMIEFYAAVARQDLEGYSDDNWHPEEALSRTAALALFTANPAYASFNEERLGTLEVGKKADITVLSGDIMEMPAADIPGVTAVMTIVDGRIVHDAAAQAAQE